jgi:hypothetical protein
MDSNGGRKTPGPAMQDSVADARRERLLFDHAKNVIFEVILAGTKKLDCVIAVREIRCGQIKANGNLAATIGCL